MRLTVSEEIKAKLDACAPYYGGRAALLRQLLAKVTGPIDSPGHPKRKDSRAVVRLSPGEFSAISLAAKDRGLSISQWISSVIRRRLFGEPRFLRSEEVALYAILSRLEVISRRLGRLVQGQTSQEEVQWADPARLIDETRQEIRQHIGAIRRAFLGNLAYWAAPDDL